MQTIVFFQTLMNALMLAGLYSLVAAGLTLVFGVMHIVNFAHGAFLMLGAYAMYYLFAQSGVEYYTSLVLCVLVAGALGVLVERHLYHRYWGQVLPCLAVALGLSQIMQNGSLIVFGVTEKAIDSIFTGVISIFGIRFSFERFMVIVLSYSLIAALAVFLRTTKQGQAMRAVAQDYDAAALLGIKPHRIAMLAMFIGVGLAAAAGGHHRTGVCDPCLYGRAVAGQGIPDHTCWGDWEACLAPIVAGLILGFPGEFRHDLPRLLLPASGVCSRNRHSSV